MSSYSKIMLTTCQGCALGTYDIFLRNSETIQVSGKRFIIIIMFLLMYVCIHNSLFFSCFTPF